MKHHSPIATTPDANPNPVTQEEWQRMHNQIVTLMRERDEARADLAHLSPIAAAFTGKNPCPGTQGEEESGLSDRMFKLACCVHSARAIAETLDCAVPDTFDSFRLEDAERIHGVVCGISLLLAPADDKLFDLYEYFSKIEEANPAKAQA